MPGTKPLRMPGKLGREKKSFHQEGNADGGNKRHDEGLDVSETLVLQEQHDQHIQSGDQAAPHERNAEEQLQPDGRTHHFRQVARGDGQFAQHPQEPHGWRGIMGAAGLRKITTGDHAQLDAQVLKQNRHEVG